MKSRTSLRMMMRAAFVSLLTNAAIAQLAPIAYWRFDESSGGITPDSTGTYPGTLRGGATFVSGGVSGNALSLASASGSFVDMGTSFPGFTSGDFSLSLWIKTSNDGVMPIGKQRDSTDNGYFIYVGQSGPLGSPTKAWFFANNSTGAQLVSTSSVNTGTWQHIVATYVAGGSMKIYVNGVFEVSQLGSPIQANAASLLIGGSTHNDLSEYPRFDGLIDDVQVYGAALSDVQVSWLTSHPGAAIPEPSTYVALFGLAALGFAGWRRGHRG